MTKILIDEATVELALGALKELVAQTETGLFAVRHDHVAMNDARQAITALREALAEQPAQRTWVGLTDEEMQALWDRFAHMEMMRAILGYDKEGQPIHETKPGYMYTAACIMCCKCRKLIRGSGGPKHGSLCVPCHDKDQP